MDLLDHQKGKVKYKTILNIKQAKEYWNIKSSKGAKYYELPTKIDDFKYESID